MREFGILFIIFGVCIFCVAIYLYTGHRSRRLLPRTPIQQQTKSYLRMVGRILILLSLSPIFGGSVALVMKEESMLPMIVFLVSFIVLFIIGVKVFKEK